MNAMKRRRLKNWEIEMEMHETRKPSRRIGLCVYMPDDVNGNHMRCTFQMCLVNASNLKFGTEMTIEPKFQRAYLLLTTKGNSLIFRPIQWRTFIPIVSHTNAHRTGNWLVMMAVCCLQLQNVCPDCFLCCHPIEPESFETRLFSLHWKWNIPEPERFDIHTRKNCTPTRKKRDKNIGIVLRHLNGCVSMWLAAIWPRIQAKRMHQCGFCSRSDGGKNEK